MQRGDPGTARRTLQQAYSLMPLLTWALPVISMYTLLEMADTAIGLADIAGARQILREASRIVRKRPLGRLDDRFRTLQDLLDTLPTGDAGVSTLTAAELRLLPHLATHLSFPEIGERLYISRHTVKTQAMAIYRKLGASTRSEAVAAARKVGLLPVREL
jgi:LuxR family maltose regulon positive regulatory protein